MSFVVILLVSQILAARAGDLPWYFPKCCINDPNLNSCMLSVANYISPYLEKGIEELDLMSLNPAIAPLLRVMDEGPFTNYTFVAESFKFHSVHNYIMKELSFDPITLTLLGRMVHPYIPYSVNIFVEPPGKFLDFEAKANGTLTGHLANTETAFEVIGNLVERNGVKYYKPAMTRTFITMEENLTHISGLLGTDKKLENIANEWFAANTKTMGKLFAPLYEKFAAYVINGYIGLLMKNVPFSKLFPTCIIE